MAPKSLAISSLAAIVSTATIIVAPAFTQPWIALRPTPPAPNTTQTEPGSTLAVLHTAPQPVITPQPISAQRSSGTVSTIFTTLVSCSVAYSAITPQAAITLSGCPWASRVRSLPPGSAATAVLPTSHSCGRPVLQ